MVSRLLAIAVSVSLFAGCGGRKPAQQPVNDAGRVNEPGALVDPATERDLKSIQGKWLLISKKRDWVEANQNQSFYLFEGLNMTVLPKDRQPSHYTLKVDASKTPKEMDIIANWEDGTVTKSEVIYELDGDTFRWCHIDGKRPRVFLSERNSAGTLIVLQRVKAKE